MGNLISELKRRNVIKVGLAYLVISWLLIQVTTTLETALGLPEWLDGVVIVLLLIGFPMALLFAWAFELTPDGVKKTADVDADASITKSTSRKIDFIIITALVLIIGGMAYTGTFKSSENSTTVPAPTTQAEKSVAVIPFVDMSQEGDHEWFSDGLTDEILNSLTQLPELKITARTSAFYFKGKNIPIPEVAKQLNVAHVVEGSVRKAGNMLRITAQLIRASDDKHLWSQTYDRPAEDIFEIQQDVAESIAQALDVVLDDERRETMISTGTRNVEAFESYRKGLTLDAAVHNFESDKSLWDVNEYYKKAIAADPQYDPPYNGIQDAYYHYLLDGPNNHFVKDNLPEGLTPNLAYKQITYYSEKSIEHASSESRKLQYELIKVGFSDDWRRLPSIINNLGAVDFNEAIGWMPEIVFAINRSDLIVNRMITNLKESPYQPLTWNSLYYHYQNEKKFDKALEMITYPRSLGIVSPWIEDSEFLYYIGVNDKEKLARLLIDNPSRIEANNAMALAFLGREEEALEKIKAHYVADQTRVSYIFAYHYMDRQEDANALASQIDTEYLGVLLFAFMREPVTGKIPVPMSTTPNYVRKLRQAGLSEEKIQSMFLPSSIGDSESPFSPNSNDETF